MRDEIENVTVNYLRIDLQKPLRVTEVPSYEEVKANPTAYDQVPLVALQQAKRGTPEHDGVRHRGHSICYISDPTQPCGKEYLPNRANPFNGASHDAR